ncbi:FAD-dependent oxidoreductase [Exiguobacterium sp.]|uniref:dihydrolipoyl dehydrogenase family protein n=1 Tax=Exiguobacterium sp. TaxID=44751 RepID=UPI000EBFC394|nr:FAD-dependent oxidoreductase [Exiguobacterium sp.]HCV53771.1 pyridine nucleotide-disulfide oxidoreductase [Exiguobacterium sp.]
MKTYQLVVIGGGAAGMTIAAGAASLGAHVALIERHAHLGGDCLHYGCVPSKALIEAAHDVHVMKRTAEKYNVTLNGDAVYSKTKASVDRARNIIQSHDGTKRFEDLGVDVYIGEATFLSAHEVEVAGQLVVGEKFAISTGSQPIIPPIDGLDTIDYLTNETIFELTERPERLLVIGGGAIGLELSQAYAHLGTEVTVIEGMKTLLGKEDRDMVEVIQRQLEQELTLHLDTKVTHVRKSAGGIEVTVEANGESRVIETDAVLVAVGRKPRIEALRLDRAGVHVEKGFVQVDGSLRTSQRHIFAVGDTIDSLPFTHAAGLEGKTVVTNALFGLRTKPDYRAVPWVTFTTPELFHLGLTEEEARKKHGDIKVYQTGLDEVDRFVINGQTEGRVKLIADKRGKLIGAHAIGEQAGEWMQEVVYAMARKDKVGQLSRVVHPYPIRGAAVQRAADVYWRERLFAGPIPKWLKRYFDWKQGE